MHIISKTTNRNSSLSEPTEISPCEAPQCSIAQASLWHLWNDPHPQSSLLHLFLLAPVKPPHPPDAEIVEWVNKECYKKHKEVNLLK